MTIRITNASDFTRKIEKVARAMETNTDVLSKALAFKAYGQGVTPKTPVDTGRARAAWNISPNKIDYSTPPEDFSGGAQAAQASNKQKMSAVGSPKDVQSWYITNAVIYVPFLEAGRSKQADAGQMVARTLVEIRSEVEKLFREIFK